MEISVSFVDIHIMKLAIYITTLNISVYSKMYWSMQVLYTFHPGIVSGHWLPEVESRCYTHWRGYMTMERMAG